jgi:hypothetical protein
MHTTRIFLNKNKFCVNYIYMHIRIFNECTRTLFIKILYIFYKK